VSAPLAEELTPGLWSIRVPIPDSPLRFTFVYVFATDGGPVLVDAGWNAAEAYETLDAGLRSIGSAVASVYGVLVTHHHRDHAGLVPRIVRESGAYAAAHPADAEILREPSWFRGRIDIEELGADGVPEATVVAMQAASAARFPPLEPVNRIRELADGEPADVPGWDVRVVWTPGHTPGHCCFQVVRGDRVFLLSGDHVLPRITPNIGLTSIGNVNPLRDFRRSLRKVAELAPDAEVLPAHERRFSGLAQRVVQIEAHHDVRTRELVEILEQGPKTPWEIARELTWRHPWDSLDPLGQLSALNEARAHLALLADEGHIVSSEIPRTFSVAER
jgi:glyoxylase-like metal-dependent hydrolase (beta-lactamase superfamily II)